MTTSTVEYWIIVLLSTWHYLPHRRARFQLQTQIHRALETLENAIFIDNVDCFSVLSIQTKTDCSTLLFHSLHLWFIQRIIFYAFSLTIIRIHLAANWIIIQLRIHVRSLAHSLDRMLRNQFTHYNRQEAEIRRKSMTWHWTTSTAVHSLYLHRMYWSLSFEERKIN